MGETYRRSFLSDLYLITFFSLSIMVLCRGSAVGICYGRNADDLPPPEKVVQLIRKHNIKYVRIYDSDIQVISAFARSGVELIVGISNMDLLAISQFQSNADAWLKNSILPHYPNAKITHVTVGAELTETSDNVSSLVVPAMRNVLKALTKVGLEKRIKVSSVHSLGVLSRSFPPSAGAFSSKHASFIKPMLDFLAENQSPFMVDVYPYFAYQDKANNVSLEYALFESTSEMIDPNTGLLYSNLLDAQVDAIYYALMSLNYQTIKVVVTETGWPSKGSKKERGASSENAQTYNTNLIRHVINSTGTPAKRGEPLDVYVFSLFNENRKPGPDSERNWGIFYPDGTSVYNVDFTGSLVVNMPSNISANGSSWCIASSNISDTDLQNALDWACGSGNVDCSPIQPSQPCFQPDTLLSHASYAFNSFYQQNAASDTACNFGGKGIKVFKDPSYDKCIYLRMGTNKTTTRNATLNATTSVAWITSYNKDTAFFLISFLLYSLGLLHPPF